MMAQGDFLAAEREADGTEKTESQVTAKLTAGPSARASEAFSEQVRNPQSRAPTDLQRDGTQREGESQIDSSAKEDELFGVQSSLADGAVGDRARLENQDTEFSMQNQNEPFFRDRVIDENAQII
jgi:hypothetical protein